MFFFHLFFSGYIFKGYFFCVILREVVALKNADIRARLKCPHLFILVLPKFFEKIFPTHVECLLANAKFELF